MLACAFWLSPNQPINNVKTSSVLAGKHIAGIGSWWEKAVYGNRALLAVGHSFFAAPCLRRWLRPVMRVVNAGCELNCQNTTVW